MRIKKISKNAVVLTFCTVALCSAISCTDEPLDMDSQITLTTENENSASCPTPAPTPPPRIPDYIIIDGDTIFLNKPTIGLVSKK